MEDRERRALVASIRCPGWRFRLISTGPSECRIDRVQPPIDIHGTDPLPDFGESFFIPAEWDADQIVRRAFATLQFLTDHELREQFTVAGERAFEAHEKRLTGPQHDWFVEHESAVKGY